MKDDSDEDIDYLTLGKAEINEQDILKYFPRNDQGVSFSSKEYIPIASIHRAPNPRLEISLKEHIEFLKSLDLQGICNFLGISSNS